MNKVYFAINIISDHWAAGYMKIDKKRILCYDSLIKHLRQERFNIEMKSISVLIPKMLMNVKVIVPHG